MSEQFDWMPTEDIFKQCDRVWIGRQSVGDHRVNYHLWWGNYKTDILDHKTIKIDGFVSGRHLKRDVMQELRAYFVGEPHWKLIDDTQKDIRLYARIDRY